MIRRLFACVCLVFCASAFWDHSAICANEPDSLYEQAMGALQQENFEKAFRLAQRLTTFYPEETAADGI